MVRPVKFPVPVVPFVGQLADNQMTRTVPYLENSTGIDKRITTEQMTPDNASELENFYFNEAHKLQTRGGTLKLGDNTADNIVHLAKYERGDKTTYLVRWTETTIQYYYSGSWQSFTGSLPTLSFVKRVYHAAWGPNTLLFVNDSKVYALDFTAFTCTQVAASPANSQHIYVFGNRAVVVAPGTNYTRVQWSIKNDYTDWSGDGSGFEDMIPGPTGAGDRVLGGFSINDTEALVVRSNSVWLQGLTGAVDAPFSFRFLYPVSVTSVASAAVAPGGVFCLGTNNVYFLDSSKPNLIGDPIKNKYIDDISHLYGKGNVPSFDPTAGAWDEFRQVYYLSIPFNDQTNKEGDLLLYHRNYNAWTSFHYPFIVSRVCVLNGLLDANSIDTYLNRGPVLSKFFDGTDSWVVYEDPFEDSDLKSDGTTEDLMCFCTMAALKPSQWDRRVKFESMTIDINGGTSSTLTASAQLFAPSKYNDVTFETITISTNVFIQTNKLRQRQTFFGVRERNGIVPKITFISSPYVALNAVYVTYSDGSLFLPTTVTSTTDRITVDLVERITVDGQQRITV